MKHGTNKGHDRGLARVLTQLLLLTCFGMGSIIKQTPAALAKEEGNTGASASKTRPTSGEQANASARPELVPQVNSPGGSQIAISPDGRLLASSGRGDSAVGLWEISTGRELRTFSGSGAVIYAIAFSPEGKLLAAQSGDQTVEIWDVVSGGELNTLSIPDRSAGPGGFAAALANRYAGVAFGPGGRIIAASNGRAVAVWEVGSGSLLSSLSDDFGIQGFGLRPDGRELALIVTEPAQLKLPKVQGGGRGQFGGGFPFPRIGGGGRPSGGVTLPASMMPRQPSLKIIDVKTGKEARSDHLPDAIGLGGTASPAYRSSDSHLLILGFSRQVTVWDATSGRDLPAMSAQGQQWLTHALSPNGGLLAVCEISFSSTGSAQSVTGSTRVLDVATGRELKDLAAASAVAFSPDGHVLATADFDSIKIWDTATWTNSAALTGHSGMPLAASFSRDGRRLFTGNKTIWDLATGTGLPARAVSSASDAAPVAPPSISPDGQLIAIAAGNSRIRIVDASTDRELNTVGQPDDSASPSLMIFSPDGRVLASAYRDSAQQIMESNARLTPTASGTGTSRAVTRMDPAQLNQALQNQHSPMENKIELWDVVSGRELKALAAENPVQSIAFSPDGRLMVSASYRPIAPAARFSSGPVATARNKKGGVPGFGRQPAPLSAPPGGTGATSGEVITFWDIATGQQTRSIDCGGQDARVIAISPDGHLLAATGQTTEVSPRDIADGLKHGIKSLISTRVWSLDTGQAMLNLGPITHPSSIWGSLLAFSPDSRILAASGNDNTIDLWDASGQRLRTLRGGSSAPTSIAFSPDGRMVATSNLDGTVLWDVETGNRLATLVSIHDGGDWLVVTPDGLFDGSPAAWNQILWRYNNDTFNVAPVEWFFNEFYYPGLLGDIIAGKRPHADLDISTKDRRQPKVSLSLPDGQTSADGSLGSRTVKIKIDITGAQAGARDLRLFRNGSLVKVWRGDILKGQPTAALEVEIPIVAGENRLTAYAFNHDNVKSVDAVLPLVGAASLKRAGTLYILAIGVNSYTNPEYNLHFASPDAKAFADEVRSQQSRQGNYSKTEVISLFDAEATKHNILLALGRFGANEKGALPAGVPPSLRKFTRIEPEDAVVVYYAGHGTAQKSHFYLIPHDLGYAGRRDSLDARGLQTILDHSISDQELEQAFEVIDAGRLLLVVDACNSGQALDAEEKRRGPMNSKGLAQLAYEKGMYILTAAQSYQAALEASQLGHGYLTYALVEEGLKTAAADTSPKDGQVTIREWLDFATERVPQMQQARMRDSRDLLHKVVFVEGDENVADVEKRNVQRPRVFYRRELEAQPMVVAKVQP